MAGDLLLRAVDLPAARAPLDHRREARPRVVERVVGYVSEARGASGVWAMWSRAPAAMEECWFNAPMLVTLLHAAGCTQVATSLDRGAPRADATAEPSPAPQDVGEATDRGVEVGVDVDADGVDGDTAGYGLDAGDVSEDPDGGDLDVSRDLVADADLPSDPDADLPADAVNGDGYGDAFLNWLGNLGGEQLLVGGPDRRVLRSACSLLTNWIGHGDVDADGYEDVMTTTATRGTWTEAFALLPGGPDVGRAVRCGLVSRSTGTWTPLRLPPVVRAHVFDENDDGYDDVVFDDDWVSMGTYQIFRGGPSGIPFTEFRAPL